MNTELTPYTIITNANLTNIIHNAKLFVYFEINATIKVTISATTSDRLTFYITTPDRASTRSEYMLSSKFEGTGTLTITKNVSSSSSSLVGGGMTCVAFNKFTYNSMKSTEGTDYSVNTNWTIDTNDSIIIEPQAQVWESSSDSYNISGDITAYYI